MGRPKLTSEEVRASFTSECYTIPVDWKYVNRDTKIPFICSNGHSHSITWGAWKGGSRCRYCGLNIPSTEKIRTSFLSEGYVIPEDWEYVNNKIKIPYVCDKGHEHNTSWAKWNDKGTRCRYCSLNIPSTEKIRTSFLSEGYILPEDWEYVNNTVKIPYVCDKGHEWSTLWQDWYSAKVRCGLCSDMYNNNSESVIKLFSKECYTIPVDWKYVNRDTKIPFICNNGHSHNITLGAWKQGQRCCFCFCTNKDKVYELATIDILNEYGIIYDYQHTIKVNNNQFYYVDFYLYDYDFFLEVDERHHKYQVDNDRIREGVITGLTGIKFERIEAVHLETFKEDLIDLLCL